MLTYYRYKVEKGMMTLEEVPQPYRDMLRSEGYLEEGSVSSK